MDRKPSGKFLILQNYSIGSLIQVTFRKILDPPKRPLSPFNFNDFHYKRSVYTAFTSLSDGDMHGNDASESSGENPAPFKWCAMEIALWC